MLRRSLLRRGGGGGGHGHGGDHGHGHGGGHHPHPNDVLHHPHMDAPSTAFKSGVATLPFLHIPGMLTRDLASRCMQAANDMISRREMVPVMKHQTVKMYRGVIPVYQDAAFMAPNSMIWGNVVLGHNASIFYHVYIRNYHLGVATVVGDNATIADNTTLMGQVQIGNNTFVGCNCSLDMCEVMNNAYISHGCTIAGGTVVEDGAVVALGTVLEKDTRVKANEYWAGNPGKFVCKVDDVIRERVQAIAAEYRELGQKHAHAIDDHVKSGLTLDEAWFKSVVAKMEARRQEVTIPVKRDVPAIAKQFMQPRVNARLPQMHARVAYPNMRQAPWLPKMADDSGNA